ncbi:putative UPF0157 protein YqkA [Patellaria atrata CBS 101060]|uniref:UPF0157 protein YqkA n=1 Tax=Patellaria atrata CBS 101060 TaxID=1346257 RepID=A0A9P4SGF6_9PEZI|nr:putative UPF0157 protein YqkA [Patellaria atrata CBS 101060]
MRPVVVEPYNPQWPLHFSQIASELINTLQDVDILRIEHVGSTSVPFLAAKPIIDVDIVILPPSLESVISALTASGYTYLGEVGIPDRHTFRKVSAVPDRNLYLCIEGSASLRNHLCVRELLRRDEALREEYARVKMELFARGLDMDEYCEGKNEILQKILERAGMGEREREEIKKANTRSLEDI